MIILGVDPGLAAVGYGLIETAGQKLLVRDYGVIKTSTERTLAERLLKISKELTKIIEQYQPRCLGVEKLFFCKNVSSALKVGEAKGVILLTASQAGLAVREFTPLEIKQTVAGYGQADKEQVQKMVKLLLNLKVLPQPDHAADALAAAITCSRYEKNII